MHHGVEKPKHSYDVARVMYNFNPAKYVSKYLYLCYPQTLYAAASFCEQYGNDLHASQLVPSQAYYRQFLLSLSAVMKNIELFQMF